MYRKIKDFIDDWKMESEATTGIIRACTDESLSKQVAEGCRNLGYIAWHIAHTLGEMSGRAGLNVSAPPEDAPMPETVDEIARIYETSAKSVAEEVEKNWNDESLNDEIDMYGEQWKKGMMLLALIKHEGHHRGQMTILMRQAGLKVPGVYGPSKEEWEKYNLPPMK